MSRFLKGIGVSAPQALPRALVVGALIVAAGADARAQSVESFYKGKTLAITISSGEGGTNDAYARLIANTIGRYIPGNPMVVPRNLPGAGGLRAANFIHDVAPKDGTAMAVVQRGVIIQPLVDIQSATYDPSKLNWIGSTAREVSVGVAWTASTDVRTIQDAMKKEVIVGSSGVGNDTGAFPLVLNRFIGTQFKPIHGYKSGSEITLAFERGEVQGRVGWSWGSVKSRGQEWLRDGKIKVLVQMGINKADDLPDVPLILDLAKTQEDREAMLMIFSPTYIGWPSVMPPNVPADRLQAVRRAYDQAMQDPELRAMAAKQDLDLDPMSGEEIQKVVTQLYALSPAVVERARVAMTAVGGN
ncbi:MAG TPA: tripartite tricarboxylate transporter substrate-binding protein [Alphaproteobacteria bacterium]|jgi:tripartite-type tricarboxylate transporter receptor subunit TctC|nr:tripartite tricarboxylate transporter substrate-binding protein [Alphaproteobacteria bacterium]